MSMEYVTVWHIVVGICFHPCFVSGCIFVSTEKMINFGVENAD